MTNEARLEVRAREAVAQLFMRHLHVPEIFFEPAWPDLLAGASFLRGWKPVDVLAIDRAGSGDLHIVEIKYDSAEILDAIKRLMAAPAHYRWVAYFDETVRHPVEKTGQLFPDSGPGRVGLISIKRSQPRDELSAEIFVKAERFVGLKYSQIDRFKKKHEPDMCIR